MHSKLTITEFRDKLKSTTKNGHPKLKFTTPFSWLFYDASKPFYGLYDDHSFSLTSNLSINQSVFTLRGYYKVVDHQLQIDYKVCPRYKYQYYFWGLWVISVFCFQMYINVTFSKHNPREPLILINVFLLFMIGFATLSTILSKKNLEKRFIKVFEIQP